MEQDTLEAAEKSPIGNFDPIFGFELKIANPEQILSLGAIKDEDVRREEYKKKRIQIEIQDELYDAEDPRQLTLPLLFAKSLLFYKRKMMKEKEDLENKHERDFLYLREEGRFNILRTLRYCDAPFCPFNKTLRPIRRQMFETSAVEAISSIASKISKESEFVYTSYGSSLLMSDFQILKHVIGVHVHKLRIQLIDEGYHHWLSLQREDLSSNEIYVSPSVKLSETFYAPHENSTPSRFGNHPPPKYFWDSEDLELLHASQALVVNDAIFQFVEWMTNYSSSSLSSLQVILFESPQDFLRECEARPSAKSHVIVACDMRDPTSLPRLLPMGLRSEGRAVSLHGNGVQQEVSLCVSDVTGHPRKVFDLDKRTWTVFPPVPTPPTTPQPFRPPTWAVAPKSNYILRFLDNKEVTLPSKKGIVLGRNGDICDVELDYPLVSRIHAAIVFNTSEESFLIDLNSRSGSAIDGLPLASLSFVRLPTNSVISFAGELRVTFTRQKRKRTLEGKEEKEEKPLKKSQRGDEIN